MISSGMGQAESTTLSKRGEAVSTNMANHVDTKVRPKSRAGDSKHSSKNL